MNNLFKLNPTISIEPTTYRVAWISFTEPTPTRYSDHLTLHGDAARWLYLALTGHPIDEHPDSSSTFLARAARAYIERQAGQPPYQLAYQSIQQWGNHIRPWLGVALHDPNTGKQIEDAPEYLILIDLETGGPIPLGEILYTTRVTR